MASVISAATYRASTDAIGGDGAPRRRAPVPPVRINFRLAGAQVAALLGDAALTVAKAYRNRSWSTRWTTQRPRCARGCRRRAVNVRQVGPEHGRVVEVLVERRHAAEPDLSVEPNVVPGSEMPDHGDMHLHPVDGA